jgi:DNA phosphorothioation-dependent restriction protein DptG
MLNFRLLAACLLSFLFIQLVKADDVKAEFQKMWNDVVMDVKEAETPIEKREILNNFFDDMMEALTTAENSQLLNDEDLKGIDYLQKKITEQKNELNGLNGFEKVGDGQLNDFADYTLQEIEQADTVLTISLTTLLLIIILAILIF